MKPAARTARAPQRRAPEPQGPAKPPGMRREFSDEDQAEIQDTALLRAGRARGEHVRAYELDGVMRFERVAEVLRGPGAKL